MNEVDLSVDCGARRARKRALVVTTEFAEANGTLTTLEGPVAYQRGDALLTGDHGERWPVPRARFDTTYEAQAPLRPGKPGRYLKRPLLVWAKQLRERIEVRLDANRGMLHGEPGDWLVQYAPGDQSVVAAVIFAESYELLD
ncbi:MAG: PGDYG domain-containing protein [Casimicrobiaceae bacterium]